MTHEGGKPQMDGWAHKLKSGAQASKRVYSHHRIGIPGFANKNIGCPIIQLVDS